jgi:hypothetical protein
MGGAVGGAIGMYNLLSLSPPHNICMYTRERERERGYGKRVSSLLWIKLEKFRGEQRRILLQFVRYATNFPSASLCGMARKFCVQNLKEIYRILSLTRAKCLHQENAAFTSERTFISKRGCLL